MLANMRSRGNRLAGNIHWLRSFYLTNSTIAVFVIVIYIFDIQWKLIPNFVANDLVYLLIDYAIILIIWLAVDALGIMENYSYLADLYPNQGLRWLDFLMILLPAAVGGVLWRYNMLSRSILLASGLMFINGILSVLQHRYRYDTDQLENFQDQSSGNTPSQMDTEIDER